MSLQSHGDFLFLTNYDDPFRAGGIVMFNVKNRNISAAHRLVTVHEEDDVKVLHRTYIVTFFCSLTSTSSSIKLCIY
ncbi:hypothetical protein EON65_21225 [archaeon]|nr:MAG: hypothetical protein EON65_21225 [archaeon]